MTDAESYILALGRLARSTPFAWDEFLREFKKHTDGLVANLLASTNDGDTFFHKGMAKEASKLLDDFTHAIKKSEALEIKLKSK